MELDKNLTCPKCNGKSFRVEREVTYIYSYKFSSYNLEETSEKTEAMPFLFDNREKGDSQEFIICEDCGERYLISLEDRNKNIDMTILRKAIRADYVTEPQYFG
jgi:transcription elongation factor Elf1